MRKPPSITRKPQRPMRPATAKRPVIMPRLPLPTPDAELHEAGERAYASVAVPAPAVAARSAAG